MTALTTILRCARRG